MENSYKSSISKTVGVDFAIKENYVQKCRPRLKIIS